MFLYVKLKDNCLTELPPLGTRQCWCDIPCERYDYGAVISNSLLDTYKIKQDVLNEKKSQTLLDKHKNAMEISFQVSPLTCHRRAKLPITAPVFV